MKTVGIITYHHYYNYGTMLQAYALQKKIELLGYYSELIDFQQNNSLTSFQLLKIRIKRLPVYLKEHRKYSILASTKEEFFERNAAYDSFYVRYLKVGNFLYTNSDLLKDNPPIYDGYVVGSDQTWNPYVAKNSEAFYLVFVEDNNKKGSYAPSLAISQLTEQQKNMFKSRLRSFSFLSCRELTGTKLLKNVLGRDVLNVLDPTLLLDWGDWQKVSTAAEEKDQYILTYFLGDVKKHRLFVHKLAKRTNLKVVTLPISYLDIIDPVFEKRWVGPDQFLSLIKNAKFVCTDSFHGTAFSINFGVNFFSFCKTNDSEKLSGNSRLYDLLNLLGLSSRLVNEKNEEKLIRELPEINYTMINDILDREKEKSVEYLKRMLATITE